MLPQTLISQYPVYFLIKSRSNIKWSTTDSNATSNTDISISCLFPDQIKVKHQMKYSRLKCYLKHWYLNITVYYLMKSRSNIQWSTTDSNATSNTDISISCLFPDQIKVKHQMKYSRLKCYLKHWYLNVLSISWSNQGQTSNEVQQTLMLPQTLISQYHCLLTSWNQIKLQMKYSRLMLPKHWYLSITVYFLIKSRSNIKWSTTDSNATSNTDISISCLFPDQIKVKHQMKYNRL